MPNTHPLHAPKLSIVFGGLLAVFGVGIALMAPTLFWPGAALCYVAAAATVWLYFDEFKSSISLGMRALFNTERTIVAVFFVLEFLVPSYLIEQHIEGASISPTDKASRIVITRFEVVPLIKADPKSDYVVNIYMANHGNIYGYAGGTTSWVQLSDQEVDQNELEKTMAKITDQAVQGFITKPPARHEQLEVGQEMWMTTWRMKSDEWSAVVSGKKYFYVFIAITSSDENFSDKKFWVSEYCGSPLNGGAVIKICSQRTFLHG